MKKTLLFMVVLMAGSIVNAGFINWTSDQLEQDPEVGSSLEGGWLVALYLDVDENNQDEGSWFNNLRLDNSGVVTSLGFTSDDQLLGVTSTLVDVGGPIVLNPKTDLDVSPDFSRIYSVIFDNANMASASSFVVADSTPFDVGDADGLTTPKAYNLGNSIAGNFQAIPEPTVAALIGLFGGGMLVARRLFAKQA